MFKKLIFIFFFCIANLSNAQDEIVQINDDLGEVTDEFQFNFFEGLRQKNIKNYDKAVERFIECKILNPKESSVYFLIGEIFLAQNKYNESLPYLEKATELERKRWYLDALYKNYYKLSDYNNATLILKELRSHHKKYGPILIQALMHQKKYDEIITILDKIDKEEGLDKDRDKIRYRIYRILKDDKKQESFLKERITQQPYYEYNYLQLMHLYASKKDLVNVSKTADLLQKKLPNSEEVHLYLYKNHIENLEIDKALVSAQVIFDSYNLSDLKKNRTLKDIIDFIEKNPEHQDKFNEIINSLKGSSNQSLNKYIADYFYRNNKTEKALEYLDKNLDQNANDYESNLRSIVVNLDVKNYKQALEKSKKALDLFPAQPKIYYLNALSNFKLSNYSDALETLELGEDFITNNILLSDFYKLYADIYKAKGDEKNRMKYLKKAQEALTK